GRPPPARPDPRPQADGRQPHARGTARKPRRPAAPRPLRLPPHPPADHALIITPAATRPRPSRYDARASEVSRRAQETMNPIQRALPALFSLIALALPASAA